MNRLNRTIIIGRISEEPENLDKSKTPICIFSVVTSTRNTNGEESKKVERIVSKGKQAAVCKEHLRKGDLVCVEGILTTEVYDANEKLTFNTPLIASDRIAFLGNTVRATGN